MSFDMFNKENTIKEQNKVNEKVKKLEEIKTIITSFSSVEKE